MTAEEKEALWIESGKRPRELMAMARLDPDRDDSVLDYEDLPDPVESGEEAIAQLEEAIDLLASVVKELKALTNPEA